MVIEESGVELFEFVLGLDGCGLTVTDQENLAQALRTELDCCGSCGADLGPSEDGPWGPWHWPWEDCRAVRTGESYGS